jgi:hypothetical protein
MMRRLGMQRIQRRPCASTTIISPNFAFVAEETVGAAEPAASAIAVNDAISATVTTAAHTTKPEGRPRRRDRSVCCNV